MLIAQATIISACAAPAIKSTPTPMYFLLKEERGTSSSSAARRAGEKRGIPIAITIALGVAYPDEKVDFASLQSARRVH